MAGVLNYVHKGLSTSDKFLKMQRKNRLLHGLKREHPEDSSGVMAGFPERDLIDDKGADWRSIPGKRRAVEKVEFSEFTEIKQDLVLSCADCVSSGHG